VHKYTVSTSEGDVNVTTPKHHTTYETLQEWIDDHKDEIAVACGVSSVGLTIFNIWLTHGRGGPKLT
jgi:hypothetical protein